MSYIVSVKRQIQKSELLSVIEGNDKFKLISETEDGVEIHYLKNNEKPEVLFLSQGEIQATSPSESAYAAVEKLAASLPANGNGPTFIGTSTWVAASNT